MYIECQHGAKRIQLILDFLSGYKIISTALLCFRSDCVPVQNRMTANYVANFRQNFILGRSVNSRMKTKCHVFSRKENESDILGHNAEMQAGKIVENPCLYGPAMKLDERTIIYPCIQFRCSIPCPCLICGKKHPTCRVPSNKACSCDDCVKQFNDHISFHAAFHFGCKFCFQLVKIMPNFDFFFHDVKGKSECMIQPIKHISGEDLPGGIFCRDCRFRTTSFKFLKEHLENGDRYICSSGESHTSSKMFHHF